MNAIAIVTVLIEGREYVKCAALRLQNGELFYGVDHADCFEQMMAQYGEDKAVELSDTCDDGFMTNTHRFVDRNEAYALAQAAKQYKTHYDVEEPNTLDSANVKDHPRYYKGT